MANILLAAHFAPGEPIPRSLLHATLDLAHLPSAEQALAFEDALVRLEELGLSDQPVQAHYACTG